MDAPEYDVAVIGGGVVGCAVVNKLTTKGYTCVLFEKNPDLVSESSAGNSGMLHCGFDAPFGSTELKCIQESQRVIYDFLDKTRLPYSRIGATMVAWTDQQVYRLQKVLQICSHMGFNARQLSPSELYAREAKLSRDAKSAIWIPEEAVVDPWLMPIALAHQAKRKGAKIFTRTTVEACENYSNNKWKIHTDRGICRCKLIVNCAGIYGDFVDSLAGISNFRILPRKGQYIVYSKSARDMIGSSILPVPTEITKGVIVFKTVYDNIVVGPTAENTKIRTSAAIDDIITKKLINYAESVIPQLRHHNIVNMYTGIRPATETKDYHLNSDLDRNWLTVGGIRSTGLSACLGISSMVHSILENDFGLEPSVPENQSISRLGYKFVDRNSVEIDSQMYTITHPITRTGITHGGLTKL